MMSEEKEVKVTFWQRVLELFEDSIITQSLLTILFGGALVYMYIAGKEIPDAFLTLTAGIIGYWFKSKNDLQIKRIAAATQVCDVEK